MNDEQFRRLDLVKKSIAGFITEAEAAEKLGISKRQVQRLKKGVRENGEAAMIHKNTHRKPSHAIPDELKGKILVIRSKAGFKDANFKHFQELLETEYGITISYSSLYRLLKENNVASPKKRRRFKPHRRRKRRPQAGSMVQMDASPYDWLNTGKRYTLHGAIDDATGQVVGLFLCQNECMQGYHEVMRRMITVFGIPEAIYADRHTIFRSPNADKAKAEDAPPGIKAHETQFGRALNELGIQIIAARSPQAKGRIERLWETLQSRLPIVFRIQDITTLESANEYLRNYIFDFNSNFAVEPSDVDSAFLPLDAGSNLDYILCVKEIRTLDHGQVFSFQGKRLQIEKAPYSNYIPPKAKVTVMVSPYIGVMVSYLSYVFSTKPAPHRPRYQEKTKQSHIKTTEQGHSPSRWEPQSGLP
ncbi:MAG: ISNCY family transposase, partial [Coriobacteriia bacterium]|nr:ISNCY family transposase [Coriobacteriia bacterium]